MLSMGVGAAATGSAPMAAGIATGTKVGILAAVGGLVFAVVVLGRCRSPLTRYHLPALLLVGLAITGTVGSAVGYEQDRRAADRVDYSVEPCEQRAAGSPGPTTGSTDAEVTTVAEGEIDFEFEELSPEAQEVFLQTLDNDGSYSTRVRPDDIEYATDTQAINSVRYESACYAFVADTPSVIPVYILYYLFTGLISVAMLLVGTWSLEMPSFKIPIAFTASLIGGFGTVDVLAGSLSAIGDIALVFVVTAIAGFVLTENALRRLEQRHGERFVERMSDDPPGE